MKMNIKQFVITVESRGADKYAVEIVDDTDCDTYVLWSYDPTYTPNLTINESGVDPNDLSILHDAILRICKSNQG